MTPRALHLLSVIEVQQRHSGSATLASLSRALPNDPDTIREDLQALVAAALINEVDYGDGPEYEYRPYQITNFREDI